MPADMITRSRTIILTVALVLASGMPAAAQQPLASDLQALRFYLDQSNSNAVQAELLRLQLQFPGWSPPADLSSLLASDGPDNIDAIYRLIESGNFDQARALIAETDRAFADWSPPADLLSLLSLSEAQVAFTAAVAARQPETAIGISRGIPALMSCERVNNAWELAEMHLLLGDTARALGIYRSVMTTCSAPETLVSTLEKADAISNLAELEALADIALAQAPGEAGRIRGVEDRLRAGRQVPARWASEESVIAIDGAVAPTAAPLAAASGQQAPPPRPEPGAASAAPAAAVQAPAPAAQPRAGGGVSAIQSAADRGAWAECLALSTGSRRIEVIYQRGWCAYNASRPMEAIEAFRIAAAQGNSSTMRRDAAYGRMLAMLQLNMTDQTAQVLSGVALTHTQRLEIESQILDQRGLRAYERGDYPRAIAFFDAHAQLTGSTRRDLELLKGYALLNMGDADAARVIFLRLHRQLATTETRRALRSVN